MSITQLPMQRMSYNSVPPSEIPEGYRPPNKMRELEKFRESQRGKDIAVWVRQAVDRSKNARSPHRGQWLQNYAFYRNKQTLNPITGLSREGQDRLAQIEKKAQRVINRIQPVVRTETAALTAQRPSAVVVPASSEDDDLFAAQSAEMVYESVYNALNLEYYYSLAALWQVVAGNGFLKIWWAPEKLDRDSKMTGYFEISAPTPFQIFVPDLLEPEIQRQQWVAHSYVKPLSELKLQYAEALKDKEITPTQYSATTDIDGAVGKVDRSENAPDSCQVIEMWLKPGAHPGLPEGGLITLVDSIVVQAVESFPYAHGNFPFYHFTHIETGTFYRESPVTPIISLQVDYNKFRGQVRESIIKSSRLQMMATKGSIVGSKWTNETGLIVETRPGLPMPTPVPVQELPSYLLNEMNQIIQDIEDITGQHQVTKGQAPGSGVTAATAISFLQEKDDAFRSSAYRSIEKSFRELGRDIIELAIQYWSEPRMVKVVGADSAFDALMLKGSQLSNSTDLRVEAGSALPTSKAAKQAFIMDLMSQGFIPPEEGLKMMEMGGTNAVVDRLRIDERQAQRENIKLKSIGPEEIALYQQAWEEQGQIDPETGEALSPPPVVPVNDWDNHEVHIKVHNNFRKSQEFEQLPQEIKVLFQEHVTMHQVYMQQVALEGMMGGLPGDGPEGGEDMEGPDDAAGGALAGQEGEVAPPEGEAPVGAETGVQEALPGLE